MAISALYDNSASIGTTEYSLPNNANYLIGSAIGTDGIYQVWIDVATNMAAGDQYQIKIYEAVQASGTSIATDLFVLEGKQSFPFVIPSLILLNKWDITVKLLAGTARTIAWSIRQVA